MGLMTAARSALVFLHRLPDGGPGAGDAPVDIAGTVMVFRFLRSPFQVLALETPYDRPSRYFS
jgi:hypothetical protein